MPLKFSNVWKVLAALVLLPAAPLWCRDASSFIFDGGMVPSEVSARLAADLASSAREETSLLDSVPALPIAPVDRKPAPIGALASLEGFHPSYPSAVSLEPSPFSVDGPGAMLQRVPERDLPVLKPKDFDGIEGLKAGWAQPGVLMLVLNDPKSRFRINKHGISEAGRAQLKRVAGMLLKTRRRLYLEVAGNADKRGSYGFNLRLSQARAEAIRDGLVASGVPKACFMLVKGYSYDQPLAKGSSVENFGRNRRGEVLLRVAKW
jgi:outer membrane protein OmpA-like peptidoglycan-associated protein